MTWLVAPNGQSRDVPDDQVDHYIAKGAKPVPPPNTAYGNMGPEFVGRLRAGASRLLDMAPTAGAMAGGLMGGTAGAAAGGIGAVPGMAAGAGVGGALGTAAQGVGRTLMGIPDTRSGMEQAVAPYVEGGWQAANEMTGNALAGVPGYLRQKAGPIAQSMMANALNPGARLLKYNKSMVGDALREGVPISEGMTLAGNAEMSKRLAASHDAENAIAGDAVNNFRKEWTPSYIMDRVEQQLNYGRPLNKRTGVADNPEFQRLKESFMNDYTDLPTGANPHMLESARPERPFKVGDLLDAKRAADRASFAAHEAATNRGVKATAPVDDFEEKFQKAVGDVMRGELRSEVPGLGRQMQHSRELMGLEKSYFNAEARPGEKIGSNPVTSAIRMAMAPAASSRRAISLNRFSLEQPAARAGTAVVKQLPRYLGTIRRPSGQEE